MTTNKQKQEIIDAYKQGKRMITTNTAEMVCEKCGGGLAKDWSGYHHSPAVDPAPEYDIGRHIPKPVPNPALVAIKSSPPISRAAKYPLS